MKFGTNSTRPTASIRNRAQAGFTLAEVLAALLFMAIVIPVALQGLHIASLAGEVAARKGEAMRVAERVLNENIITTNGSTAGQSGTYVEGILPFRWTVRNGPWDQDPTQTAPHLLSVEVAYKVQDKDYFVRLSTLVNSQP